MDKEVETEVKLKNTSPSLTSSSISHDPEDTQVTVANIVDNIDGEQVDKDETIFINEKNRDYQRKTKTITVEDNTEKDCNEEEVSLLDGNRASKSTRQKIVSNNRNETHSDTQMVGKSNQDRRTSTQYADIQLAEVETITEKKEKSMDKRPFSKVSNSSHHKYQISSLQTLCGPNPAKISTICLIVLSVWAAGMMLFHLNKKIDVLASNMAETQENIKTMEDNNRAFRSFSSQREMRIQKRLTKILHSIRDNDENGQKPSLPLPNVQPKEEDFTTSPGVEVVDEDDW